MKMNKAIVREVRADLQAKQQVTHKEYILIVC